MRNNAPGFIFTIALTLLLCIVSLAACGAAGDREPVSEPALNAIQDRLQLLEDREEIRRLLINYGRFLDRRDFKSFALLFAETDGEWIGGMGKAKGQQAIRRLMESTIGTDIADGSPGNFHLFMNDRIDIDGDRATAETKWMFIVQNAAGQPEPFYLGHYEDELIRENGQWKFLRRVALADIPADPENVGAE